MTTDTKRPANENQPRSLMARGIDALSRREYSRKELREKLVHALEEGQSAAEVDDVLDALESKNYLSDERYARSRVRMRSARYGNRRLAYEWSKRPYRKQATSLNGPGSFGVDVTGILPKTTKRRQDRRDF